jgi:hypothetical protein
VRRLARLHHSFHDDVKGLVDSAFPGQKALLCLGLRSKSITLKLNFQHPAQDNDPTEASCT